MRNWKMFFLLSAILSFSALNAQKIDSMLSVYHDNYQQEKLHLHFDKSVYSKGETVWFKAYIMAGETKSDYSRNFFVDWYDGNGLLIKHTIHPVFESSARGQFDVPADYTGEVLHLKAYTRWMLNFDTAFLYTKTITITGNETAAKNTRKPAIAATLHFFPEGGDLVNGVSSNVAFIAANQSGGPVAVRGAILNSKNELVDSFASVHDGMGVFSLEPVAQETYTCNWIDEYGINHTTALPVAKNNGVVIESQLQNEKVVFVAKRSAEAATELKSLHLVASMNQQMVFSAALNLAAKKNVAGEIPTGKLPTGVLQLTLFDANWVPVAERVLFIRNNGYAFFPQMSVTTKRLDKRKKNEIQITVPDTVLSNLSVSVTDAGLVHDNSSNIFSQLLLQGDVRGYIANAASYFENTDDSTRSQLDLVMMTHGWRRYRWNDIVKSKTPSLPYPMDSDYAQIKGRAYTNGQATIRNGQSITIIMQGKDSSKQYFMLPLASDGSFSQRGLIFFDTARLYYQLSGDKRLNDVATVKFNYGLPQVPFAMASRVPRLAEPDSMQLRNNASFYTASHNIKSDSGYTVLQEVTVQTKARSSIDVLDEKYTTGLFTNKNSYSFDVMNDARTRGQTDIFHYLQNLIPGLTMSLPVLGQNGAAEENGNNVPGLNWRDGTPDIFVNEMPSDAERAMGLQMSDIAYVKVFRPPFMMSANGAGASGAIAIYTRKADDTNTKFIKGLNNALFTGYTAYKEFYNPDYAATQSRIADTRPTLYWNPYLLTDKSTRSVTIEFYNNDVTRRFRVVLEGMNAAGKLARIEKIIE